MRRTRATTLLCVAGILAASTHVTTAGTGAPARGGEGRPCAGAPLGRGGPARTVLRVAHRAGAELDRWDLPLGPRGLHEESAFWNPSRIAPGAVLAAHICELARDGHRWAAQHSDL